MIHLCNSFHTQGKHLISTFFIVSSKGEEHYSVVMDKLLHWSISHWLEHYIWGGLPCLLLLLFYGGDFFLLWGFVLLIFLYCIYLMYIIMGGLDYSIHPSILFFHLSFRGRVFPMSFPLFLYFMRDCISLCISVPNMAQQPRPIMHSILIYVSLSAFP